MLVPDTRDPELLQTSQLHVRDLQARGGLGVLITSKQ